MADIDFTFYYFPSSYYSLKVRTVLGRLAGGKCRRAVNIDVTPSSALASASASTLFA